MDIEFTKIHSDAWDFLLVRLSNPNAVAGVMGYFQARTGFNPLKGFYEDGNLETVDRETFIHDKREYGIGAWDIWYEKLGWWNLAKKAGYPIGSVEAQLYYFCEELKGQTYKKLCEALKLVDNPEEAADLMYMLYLKDSDPLKTRHDDIRDASHAFYERFMHPTRIVKYARVMDDGVWIKRRSTFLSRKIAKTKKGDEFTFVAPSKNYNWYAIVYNNDIRWIPAENCQIITREETYGEHNDTVGW